MEIDFTKAEKIAREKIEQDKREMYEATKAGIEFFIKGEIAILAILSVIIYFAGVRDELIFIVILLLLSIIPSIVPFFLMLYYKWGPKDVHCFFLREGYCASIMEGEKVKFMVMRKRGYCFHYDWVVVLETEEWRNHKDYGKWNDLMTPFWGLYILWNPFEYVDHAAKMWIKSENNQPVLRIEVLKRLSLKAYPFYEEATLAEDMEGAQVNMNGTIEGTITRPFIVLYMVNKWANFKSSYMSAGFAGFVKTTTFVEMTKNRKLIGNMIYDFLNDPFSVNQEMMDRVNKDIKEGRFGSSERLPSVLQDNVKAFLNKMDEGFGFKISQILIHQIELTDKKTQEAMAERAIQEMKLRAAELKAMVEAYGTMGGFVASVAVVTGKEITEIKEEYNEDPDSFEAKYKPMLTRVLDLTKQKMATDANSYNRTDVNLNGSDGNSIGKDSTDASIKTILALVARDLSKNNSSGGSKGSSGASSKDDGEKEKKDKKEKARQAIKDAGIDLDKFEKVL